MRKTEEMLDHALRRTKNGETISTVISDFPETERSKLLEMLEIAAIVQSMPKKKLASPLKRKLYLEHEQRKPFSLFTVLRYTYPAIFATIILGLTGTVSAAMTSLPGDRLFTVKKKVQETQVALIQDPHKKAERQLKIADQRFEEAKQVLAQTDDTKTQNTAMNELKEQTEVALNEIKDLASTPEVANNLEILKRVEKVAVDQSKLAAIVDPENAKNTEDVALNTLADIKKLVATVNEQAAAIITASTSIEIEGAIIAIKNNTIKIKEDLFVIDPKITKITDPNHKELNLKDLKLKDNVLVKAEPQNDQKIAVEIMVIKEKPKVKEETKKPETPTTPIVETKPEIEIKPEQVTKPELEVIVEDSFDTHTGFIIEPPPASFE